MFNLAVAQTTNLKTPPADHVDSWKLTSSKGLEEVQGGPFFFTNCHKIKYHKKTQIKCSHKCVPFHIGKCETYKLNSNILVMTFAGIISIGLCPLIGLPKAHIRPVNNKALTQKCCMIIKLLCSLSLRTSLPISLQIKKKENIE